MLYIILFLIIGSLLGATYIFFYFFEKKIYMLEKGIIKEFCQRTDTLPALYEISKDVLIRSEEIFSEVWNLRKKEFSLRDISQNIEAYYELEQHIHHEMNFIFQVCYTNPKLRKEKKFLYLQEIIMEKSTSLGKKINYYNMIIRMYNSYIQIKNYTLLGILIPYTKKEAL